MFSKLLKNEALPATQMIWSTRVSEDPIHDQLVQAYLDYFKASEWWERNKSVRAYTAVQKQTKRIKNLAKARNDEIRKEYQEGNPRLRKHNYKG